MSLVTTAKRYRSRSALHNRSTNAVLPDPTGPPMPIFSDMRFSAKPHYTQRRSRSKQPAVLPLVTHAGDLQQRREARGRLRRVDDEPLHLSFDNRAHAGKQRLRAAMAQ